MRNCIGIDVAKKAKRDLKYGVSYLLRYITFPNRTVSTETIVSRRRNSYQTVYQDEREVHSSSQLQGYVVKIYKSFDLKGSLNVTSQKSKSGFEDYTEFGAKAIIIITM